MGDMSLQIYLLGSPRVELTDERLHLTRRNTVAVLAYLAKSRQPVFRDRLIGFLWPEFGQAAAHNNFRRNLSWLRGLLPQDTLLVDRIQVELNPAADIWSDIWVFDAALTAVAQHNHPAAELCDTCVQTLADAVNLYEGEFMAGFNLANCVEFEEWLFFEREAYRQKMVEALQKLLNWCRVNEEFERGVEYGRRWLSLDPWHEPAHRAMMTFYALTEQQAAALRQYEACVRLLDEELGIAPEAETTALYEAIRKREFEPDLLTGRRYGLNERIESASSRKPFASQVPTPATPFIGRENEVAEVLTLLAEPQTRLVTLAAPGGMGKTRLALAVASAIIPNFQHGVHFVPLAPHSSAQDIPVVLARSLQIPLSGSNPQAQLFAYLQNKQMLLVLDNFEQLLANTSDVVANGEAVGEKLIAELLQAAPQIKVLITSRERLNIMGEVVLALGGLPVDNENAVENSSAAQLFKQHAQFSHSTLIIQPEDAKSINHICHLVDGMPLALIMAASWVDMLSFAEIAEEIVQGLDFLETDMADVPQRQRSVRAVFATSWRRLTVDEQTVFGQLSIFRGGFTRQAAQTVTGASLRTLRGLMRKLFITLEANGRYQIHELLRQYGAEQLTAVQGYQVAKQAHADYYLTVLQERETDLRSHKQIVAIKEIADDFENIRAAWKWALAQKDTSAILQALEGLHLFTDYSGSYIEVVAMLKQAIDGLVPNGQQTLDPTWGRLATRYSFMRSVSSGYFEGMDEISKACLSIAGQANDRFEYAFSLYFYTFYAYIVKQESDESIAQLHQAIAIFRELGDIIFTSRSLGWLGVMTVHYAADVQQGRIYMEEALALVRSAGTVTDISFILGNLCELVLVLGDYEAGEKYIQEAVSLAAQLERPLGVAYTCVIHGLYLLLKGELDQAETQIKQGWEGAKLVDFVVILTYAPALLSLYHSLKADYALAQPLAEKGLVNPMGDHLGNILGCWAMAFAYTGLGEIALAWDYVHQTIEHIKGYPSVALLTWVLPLTAVLHTQNKQWETAVHHLALAYTHPHSPAGYLDRWPLLAQIKTQLQSELGLIPYEAAWEHGQQLDLEDLIAYLTRNNPPT